MQPVDDRCFVRHMKGLLKPERLAECRAHFNTVEADMQAKAMNARERARVAMGATTDALRFDPVWYRPWEDLPDGTLDRLRPFTYLLFPVQIRHITEEPHLVPWHQDIAYAKLLGPRGHSQLLTCFTPFDADPSKTATVEFGVPDEGEQFPFMHHAPTHMHGAVLDASEIKNLVSFELSAGDTLLFGDHAPHHSKPGPDGVIDRRSFEYRLIRPEDRLANKDYFDIELGRMVHSDEKREISLQ